MTKESPDSYYSKRLITLSKQQLQLKKKEKLWVVFRLITFILIPISIYFLFHFPELLLPIILIELFIYLFGVNQSLKNKEELRYYTNLISINSNELKALKGDFSNFYDGAKWIDSKHPFSYDFDVFGKHSIYQYLNRCCSNKGCEELANRLSNGELNYIESQGAIEDLLNHLNWTQRFRAKSFLTEDEIKLVQLSEFVKHEFSLPNFYKILGFIIPGVNIVLFILFYLNYISPTVFLMAGFISMIPLFLLMRRMKGFSHQIDTIEIVIKNMMHQVQILTELKPLSERIIKIQSQLLNASLSATKELSLLNTYVKQFGYRKNLLVGFLLNFFLAWDLQVSFKIIEWIKKNKSIVSAWEESLVDLEILICGANFRFNNFNQTCYPLLNTNEESPIELISFGHPLIDKKDRISNNFQLKNKEQFVILSGPNMAGKSTFLRSIGINLMLAKAGFPVIAKKFEFPFLHLYSSMRTSDDLTTNTSYFFAELIRLRFIVDAIEMNKGKVIIILDEILKGTNSRDKEIGSILFLKKLCDLGAKGIIATHDLKLTELAKKDNRFINLYFDSTIENDQLHFDYQLRNGVAENMNANFLMKKLKLIEFDEK